MIDARERVRLDLQRFGDAHATLAFRQHGGDYVASAAGIDDESGTTRTPVDDEPI